MDPVDRGTKSWKKIKTEENIYLRMIFKMYYVSGKAVNRGKNYKR